MPEYLIQLADGSGWRFSSTSSRAAWLEQFARTLTLSPRSDAVATTLPQIHICSESEQTGELQRLWGQEQPTRFNLGPLQVCTISTSQEMLFVTPDESDEHSWLMSMWYGLYPLYPRLLRHGHLPIHAGLAEWNGSGVLFAAPGGTGKSTTMRRLPKQWRVLCDDESWIVQTESGLSVHPMPTWSDLVLRGRTDRWPSATSLPLRHIIFLRQADHVAVRSLEHVEVATLTNQAVEQILRRAWTVLVPPDLVAVKSRMFELAEARARNLPCFLLDLNLTDSFAEQLQDAILSAGT